MSENNIEDELNKSVQKINLFLTNYIITTRKLNEYVLYLKYRQEQLYYYVDELRISIDNKMFKASLLLLRSIIELCIQITLIKPKNKVYSTPKEYLETIDNFMNELESEVNNSKSINYYLTSKKFIQLAKRYENKVGDYNSIFKNFIAIVSKEKDFSKDKFIGIIETISFHTILNKKNNDKLTLSFIKEMDILSKKPEIIEDIKYKFGMTEEKIHKFSFPIINQFRECNQELLYNNEYSELCSISHIGLDRVFLEPLTDLNEDLIYDDEYILCIYTLKKVLPLIEDNLLFTPFNFNNIDN